MCKNISNQAYRDIATTPLGFRQSFSVEHSDGNNNQNNESGVTIEDGAMVDNICKILPVFWNGDIYSESNNNIEEK